VLRALQVGEGDGGVQVASGGMAGAEWKHDMGIGGGDAKAKMDVLSLAPKDELRSSADGDTGDGKKKKSWFGSGGDKKSQAAAKSAAKKGKEKSTGPYVPQGDPFEPGGSYIPPPFDPVQSELNIKKLNMVSPSPHTRGKRERFAPPAAQPVFSNLDQSTAASRAHDSAMLTVQCPPFSLCNVTLTLSLAFASSLSSLVPSLPPDEA